MLKLIILSKWILCTRTGKVFFCFILTSQMTSLFWIWVQFLTHACLSDTWCVGLCRVRGEALQETQCPSLHRLPGETGWTRLRLAQWHENLETVEMYQSNERTSFAVLTHSLLPTQSRASALHLATKGSISELAFDGKMSWAAKNSKSPSCPLGGELQCVCVRVAGYRFGIYTVFLSHTDTMPVPWL